MPIAIKTKYHGATNYKSSRISAVTLDHNPEYRKRVFISYEHGLDGLGNHEKAAKLLAETLGWAGEWHVADGGDCYLFVRASSATKAFEVEDKRAAR